MMARHGPSWRARLRGTVQANHGDWRGLLRHFGAQADYVTGALDRFTQPALGRVGRLVFVCLGNLNRSAFAEAVARKLGAATSSYGLAAPEGERVSARTLAQAGRMAVDLGTHAATAFSRYDPEPDDLLVVMEARHARALVERGVPPSAIALLGFWSSPRRLHLQDPQGLADSYLRTCFTLIESAVDQLVEDLRSAGSPCAVRAAGQEARS